MGRKLVSYFAEADRIGGMHGKLQLAGLTRMTSTQANTVEDTPELVTRFEKAIASLRGAQKESAPRPSTPPAIANVVGDASILRKHIQVYLDLMTQRALVLGELAETIRRVNEAAADTLNCARVSVWMLDDARSKITCSDLFERNEGKHSSGIELHRKDFPSYFAALEHERTIAAHDAHRDPRTSAFSAPYLAPLGITSMLDVPIWANGKMIGVVCHEHVGPARTWNADEEKFAYLMSSMVALAAERSH